MIFRWPRVVLLLVGTASLCVGQQAADFAGTWVFRMHGQVIFQLSLASDGAGISGSFTRPSQMSMDLDGDITSISADQTSRPVTSVTPREGQLELTVDGDPFVLTLEGENRASLSMAGMFSWRLDRVDDDADIVIATRLPEPDYPQEILALREQLKGMVAEDQQARVALNKSRAEEVEVRHRPAVLRIFDRYGWVTHSLAGKDAAHNFWMLVQHQTPEIQQRLIPAMEKATQEGDASVADYAYLYDRVQMGLGKPQRWGTQAPCEDGKPTLYKVDDLAGLDERRAELRLPPVDKYLQMDALVQFCAASVK
jgi:hypothetical protein